MQVTQEFMEYHANADLKYGFVSDNFVFMPINSAKRPWNSVGMQIVAGKLMTEIRQYFYRWAQAPWCLPAGVGGNEDPCLCRIPAPGPVLGTWSFWMGA